MTDIRTENPPNIEEIRKYFPLTGKEIFAYGGVIYNPSGGMLSESLIQHEEVHFHQQMKVGVEVWWKNYLHDSAFRFDQELEAHQREFRVARRTLPREAANTARLAIADRLASKLYGNLVTRQEALKLIK